MRRKKRKTDIVALVLLIALAAGTIAVWFTASVGGTLATFYAAGDPVLIKAGIASPGATVGAENWNPGDESRVAYTVENVSELGVNVSVELKCKWENGLPDDNVSIAVVGSNKDNWKQDPSNPKIYRYDRTLTGTAYLYVSVKLLGQATGNAYQGQTYILSPTFYATAEEPQLPPPPSSEEKFGTLKVTKTVAGENPPPESFSFEVRFTGDHLDTIRFNEKNSADGVYQFELTAGQTATFTNITPETSYVISEKLSTGQEKLGWDAPSDTEGDISSVAETDTVDIINTYNAGILGEKDDDTLGDADKGETEIIVLPKTGGISGATILALIGTALTAIGTAAYLIFRRRRMSDR